MPTPLSYTFALPATLTGNAIVDSLIAGNYWLGPNWPFAGETKLSYSFMAPGTSYFATDYSPLNEYNALYELTNAQKTAITNALGTWSAVANLTFTLTSDNITNVGDLRFGGYRLMDNQTAAWAYFPDNLPVAGDVWVGMQTNDPNPVNGTYDFLTFVHEIGHALGLKHPFDTSATNNTLLNPSLDDVHFTVMSYNNNYSYLPTTPMVLDIVAIQSLYGANMSWQAGDTVYKWGANQSIFETIWDAGGNDIIDGSNQLAAVTINLNEGSYSQIGKAFTDLNNNTYVNDGLAIAIGAKIENAIGSAFNDTLIGNDLDNTLQGMAGADAMEGGNGDDTYYVDNAGDTVVEIAGAGIDTVVSSITYTLGDNLENLAVTGWADLNLTGNTLDNTLVGNNGNNLIDGVWGVDTMIGGLGNDTYLVYNSQDMIIETGTLTTEIDSVYASVSYILSANVENLTLTGTDNTNARGNELNNVLIGNTGNNTLFGGAGMDIMIGGAGNDIYNVDQFEELAVLVEKVGEGADVLNIAFTANAQTSVVDLSQNSLANVENVLLTGSGAFTITGNDLDNIMVGNTANNTLLGGAGDDQLDGGAGGDTLSGGSGNDIYIVDNIGDSVVELADEGHDLIKAAVSYTLSANIEDGLLSGTGALALTGNALNNTLAGNIGDNILDGGTGADTLTGGLGNDTYYVDNVDDIVIEQNTSASEIDTVMTSINYTLGTNLENLALLGSANLNGTGNTLNNTLTGNSGNNVLDGGVGVDTMIGGAGDDTYIIDNALDVIIESDQQTNGIDTALTSISYTLGSNVENLTLTGTANINAYGNNQNNVLTGNAGNNVMFGGLGIDTLIGGAGDDIYNIDNYWELDRLVENADEGSDVLNITFTSNLAQNEVDLRQANLQNVENVLVTGKGEFTVIGNALNNIIVGNADNNILDGGLGTDTMTGGLGNDTYRVDNVNDVVVESSTLANEIDTVMASVSYTLGANLENLTLL
ncbi:matrixin family metalloprotease, partial [Pseudomonas fluorescens]|uniref:matrixin family metalloprotease n=1 Tax=Pseudomonas fluorescens TaxID=294 RepID=UPI003748E1E2